MLFDYLEIDLAAPNFRLIPNVDEAYTVPGGTGQIANALEKATRQNIHYGRRVNRIEEQNGFVSVTAADVSQTQESHTARQIFFAAPLHSLRKISVSVDDLSQHAIDQAQTSSYASGTKLHLKFAPGFERLYTYTGILLTDTGEQIWSSSTGPGGAGLLTVLTGPLPEGHAAAVAHARRVLMSLDRICPGLSELYVGVERSDAPMSYSGSLDSGEVAHLAIHNGGTRWATIGEASSGELQGYLEGALRTAEKAVCRYLLQKRAIRRSQ